MVDVAARKVLGVGMSARLPALHAAARLKSVHNVLLQHCAEMLDSALRVSKSALQDRMKVWGAKAYGISNWELRVVELSPPSEPTPKASAGSAVTREIEDKWLLTFLGEEPVTPREFKIRPTSYSDAKEIRPSLPSKCSLTITCMLSTGT